MAWVERNAELLERLLRLHAISTDLDEAERALLREVDRLGGEALKQWMKAQGEKARQEAKQQEGLRRHSKKTADNHAVWPDRGARAVVAAAHAAGAPAV